VRLCFFALLVAVAGRAAAQGGTTEVWPELDVYWRPAERQRTFLELSASTEREGDKREATFGIYQDYLRLPRAYVRGGYRFTFSTGDASYRESRLVGELVLGGNLAPRARLVNRLRTELRWVNGEYSYRVRDRLHLQRTAPTRPRLKPWPYGTIEAYYDSRYRSIARIGGRVGAEAHVRGPLSMDLYVARQDNFRSTPKYVNAFGVVARLEY
jgi:hypothetical protein